jgi:hypothetical protein
MKERSSDVSAAISIPNLVYSATITGNEVDLTGYESATIQVIVGAITDGDFVLEIQEATASGGSYTAVDSDDLYGTGLTTAALKEPTFSSTNDSLVHTVSYIGTNKFIKVKLTESGGSTGGAICAIVNRGDARHNPAGASQLP